MGLYAVGTTGDLTLVASCPNDTTIWAAASSKYSRALSASYGLVAGTRYATGLLFVGTTAPTVHGFSGLIGAELALSPRLCASRAGLTDLPASVAVGELTDPTFVPYVTLS